MSAAPAIREKHDGAPDERENVRLWLRMLSCTTVVEKRLQRRIAEEFGSTLPRFDVLAALDRNRDGMTMGALSRALLVSNGNVTGLVQALRREGLVLIAPSPSDRRASIVRLSKKGRAHFDEAAAAMRGWIDALFAGLDGEEQGRLYGLLGLVKQSIAQAESEGRI